MTLEKLTRWMLILGLVGFACVVIVYGGYHIAMYQAHEDWNSELRAEQDRLNLDRIAHGQEPVENPF